METLRFAPVLIARKLRQGLKGFVSVSGNGYIPNFIIIDVNDTNASHPLLLKLPRGRCALSLDDMSVLCSGLKDRREVWSSLNSIHKAAADKYTSEFIELAKNVGVQTTKAVVSAIDDRDFCILLESNRELMMVEKAMAEIRLNYYHRLNCVYFDTIMDKLVIIISGVKEVFLCEKEETYFRVTKINDNAGRIAAKTEILKRLNSFHHDTVKSA